jgi:GTPase SAR1 family protein
LSQNPYKYTGPLDPAKNNIVCVPRIEEVNKVITGITRGDYIAVLGPKYIGKTTFLNLIKNKFTNAYYIYFDFNVSHLNEENFYRRLANRFLDEIPPGEMRIALADWKDDSPAFHFFDFLRKFHTEDDTKKIVLLFDEIERFPSLSTFLHVWRKVYHKRYHRKELNKYAVIVAASVDLIKLTVGPNSPFNIADIIYMKDFSDDESRKLIDEPFYQLNIEIERNAKEKLLSQISGHPQLLQHACHILADTARVSNKTITEKDVDKAIEILFSANSSIETILYEIKKNDRFKNLLQDIISSKKRKYHPNKEFSMLGAGSIVERDSYCAIRNKVYEEFIKKIVVEKKGI